MSKKMRVFVSADRLQHIYAFRNSITHNTSMNFDVVLESKAGKITIEAPPGAGMSRILERLIAAQLLRNVYASDLELPEIGLKFLPFIVSRKLRDAVTGDLTEDFRTYASRWGRPYALRWLWWELAGLAIRRFGPVGVITAVAMWFRQKIGW